MIYKVFTTSVMCYITTQKHGRIVMMISFHLSWKPPTSYQSSMLKTANIGRVTITLIFFRYNISYTFKGWYIYVIIPRMYSSLFHVCASHHIFYMISKPQQSRVSSRSLRNPNPNRNSGQDSTSCIKTLPSNHSLLE